MVESIVVAGNPGPTKPNELPLPEESILGDIWLTLFADHEAAENAMIFTLILLTVYPEYQIRVREELDH